MDYRRTLHLCAAGALLFSCVGAGRGAHPVARPAPAARPASGAVRAAEPAAGPIRSARVRAVLEQADSLRLRAAVTAGSTPAPRSIRGRSDEHTPQNPGSPAQDRSDLSSGQQGDPPGPSTSAPAGTIVPSPVTDAVAHICGKVTVCGVWWDGALGDREAYKSCMLHATPDAADLDFGSSPAEHCAAQFTGDCDAAAGDPQLGELCSLVTGTAAQWSNDYTLSRIVTHGDCAHFKTVSLPEKNVLGLRLEITADEVHVKPGPGAPKLHVCTGNLYLTQQK